MGVLDPLRSNHVILSEPQAEHLQRSRNQWYTVEVRPPRNQDVPASLPNFVSGILEIQNKWFGLRNTSPIVAYEIRRPKPSELRFQYAVPTKRLERKVRTQLKDEIPEVSFSEGVSGLPVIPEDTVGGGLLTTGKDDWYPFITEFDSPPIDAVTALLHRHAMKDTRFVIQVLFRPIAGNPVRNWWWQKQAVHQHNHLKREKEQIWGTAQPTRREKRKADEIDSKAGNARFWTSIRFLIIGSHEYTPSRVKELAGGFNRFENPDTDQYFNAVTIQPFLENRLLDFAEAVADREFAGWSRKFRATTRELAGLLSLPNRSQKNITYSQA